MLFRSVVKSLNLSERLVAEPLQTVQPYALGAIKLRDQVAVLAIDEVYLFGQSPLMTLASFSSDVEALAPRVLHANILTVSTLKSQSASFVHLRNKTVETAARIEERDALIQGAPWNPARESHGLLELRKELDAARLDIEDIEGQTERTLAALIEFGKVVATHPIHAGLVSTEAVRASMKALEDIRITNQKLAHEMLELLTRAQNSVLTSAAEND